MTTTKFRTRATDPQRCFSRQAALLAIAFTVFVTPLRSQEMAGGAYVIEDNSFLIEEAYNQEAGIIQHISNLVHTSPWATGDFAYSLTEEWPVTGQDHQLGFTLPWYRRGDPGGNGIGDILINYRRQIFAGDVAIAPRFSVIIPTGDELRGHGSGVVGYQLNLPVSKRLSEAFVGHFNAGITVLPGVRSDAPEGEVRRTLTAYTAGASLVWLAIPTLNFHLEGLVSNEGETDPGGTVQRTTEFVLNPAARFAVDIGSLQIVPGFGLPLIFSEGSRPEAMFFLYLSFEHPI